MAFKFSLGATVKCKISGIEGVVMSRTEYMYNCVRYAFQPGGEKDGKPFEWLHLDEDQVALVKEADPSLGGAAASAIDHGGPMDTPAQRPLPRRL